MDLNPGDLVVKHQLSPSWENLRRLRKEIEERLKAIHVSSCLLGSETEAISTCRPRRGIPEFLQSVARKYAISSWARRAIHFFSIPFQSLPEARKAPTANMSFLWPSALSSRDASRTFSGITTQISPILLAPKYEPQNFRDTNETMVRGQTSPQGYHQRLY